MESWQIKKAYQEQQYDRVLHEAAKSRMLRTAKEGRNSPSWENDMRLLVRRRLVYALAVLIAMVLLTVISVLAASSSAGGGGLNLLV